jgi:hypothetical protein
MLLYFCKLSVNVVYVKCPVSVFLSVSMSMSVSVPRGCSGLGSWPCSCSRSCVWQRITFNVDLLPEK